MKKIIVFLIRFLNTKKWAVIRAPRAKCTDLIASKLLVFRVPVKKLKNGLSVEILITNKWALCASSFEPLLVCFSNEVKQNRNG